MSTWWTPARRADLGLDIDDLPGVRFNITNRGWYVLYNLLRQFNVTNVDLMAGRDAYVPTGLAQEWGNALVTVAFDDYYQLGRYDGRAVVPAGIIHSRDVNKYKYNFEIAPLHGTILERWIQQIGQDLATTSTGILISGKPRKSNKLSMNLEKGQKMNLSKAVGGTLTKVRLAAGWDVRLTSGEDFDVDLSLLAVGADKKALGPEWLTWYNNKLGPNGITEHLGDNLTGDGEGDDETILLDVTKAIPDIKEFIVAATIHKAQERNQTFGDIENAFIRIIDDTTGTELNRFDLTEDTEFGVNCFLFAKLYIHNGDWNYRIISEGFKDGLPGYLRAYGLPV